MNLTGILNDREIKALCTEGGMIQPFVPEQAGRPSYGLGSFGYDIRLGSKFLVPIGGINAVLDPIAFPRGHFREIEVTDTLEVAPGSQVLAESVERFHMPDDVAGVCWGKSSYARCGLLVNVTPLECFDDQTEILTLGGWKRFEDLGEHEIVATLSDDGILEYHPIIAKQKYWHKGDMISIKGTSIDLLVTPDHTLYVRRQNKFEFERIRADEVEGYYELEFKRDAVWIGKWPKTFILNTIENEGQKTTRQIAQQTKMILREHGSLLTPEIYELLDEPKPTKRTFYRLMGILASIGAVKRTAIHLTESRSVGASHFWKFSMGDEGLFDDYGMLEPMDVPTDLWASFFGLWIAEGSAYRSAKGDWTVKVAALKTNSKRKAGGLLYKLPFNWTETNAGFTTNSKQLALYLMQFGHAHDKYIPPEIKGLSPGLLRKFLYWYMVGDGNFSTSTAGSSSKRLIDDLQEVGLKAGYPASFWVGKEDGTSINAAPQYHQNGDHYKIRFSKNATPKLGRGRDAWTRVPYEGYVYDVTVPPNHTIYVRRNGKAVWTGNCGWKGVLTIELANLSPLPIRLHIGQGIAQVVFFRGERPRRTYAEKEAGGVYQDQPGVTLPK